MEKQKNLPENVNELLVPDQHGLIELIDANETYLFASRGSFKSTVGGGLFNIRRVFEMPRSTGVGVGLTFNNLYENTVPPLKAFLLSKGFVEDVHFTICKPAPADWPKPYLGLVDKTCKNAMCWYNGTVKQFISLRRKASANGVSAQWGDFDEVKFFDQNELVDEIFPIFRGNEKYFKDCSGYLSKFFMTDKNAELSQIQWLLNKRNLVNQKKVDIVLSLALHLEKLKEEYNRSTKTRQKELSVEINAIEVRIAQLRANMVYVSEISADDVRPILGNKWYKDKQRNTKDRDWNIIYLNKDPDRPAEIFYPAFDEKIHVYESDDDIIDTEPFIIASDYQHTVAPIPIAQLSELPFQSRPHLNYVDEVYTLHPKKLRDAVKLFCTKHQYHSCKIVYYVYDHTAVSSRVDADAVFKIVVDELEQNGWYVVEIYTGQAPDHYQKYNDTIDWMTGNNPDNVGIAYNKRCVKTIISIKNAGAKTVGYGATSKTQKEKKYENTTHYPDMDQSETTHFSDAHDMINDGVIKQKLIAEASGSHSFGFK